MNWKPIINDYKETTINNQQSTINNQPSTINNQPSTINHQQSTINNQPSTINNQPSTMNILMISSTFPYPPTKGGTHGRTFNLLKLISENHKVTLITQRGEDVTDKEIEELRQYVTELIVFPRPIEIKGGIVDKIKRFSEFLFQGIPPNVRYLYLEDIQNWIDQAVADKRFDVITCEHSVNEIYIRPQWKQKIATILNHHSSIYSTCQNQLATKTSDNEWRDYLYLPLLGRYEKQIISKFSCTVVTTDEDEQQMKKFNPHANIVLIPNGVNLDTFPYRQQDSGGHKLIFIGGLDYFVNIDAACFFAQEILPIIQKKYPYTTFTLVGSKPSPEVQALAKLPGITVTGRVPSIAEYLHQATVAVIPLRAGFGMKFKTLESMAAGIPVVASNRGLEGIEVDTPNVPLRALRANTIEEYVNAISRLFEDTKLRETLSQNGRYLIEQEYTWEKLGNQYIQTIEETIQNVKQNT